MPVVFTVNARVKDWQSLQKLNNEIIVVKARALKAKRCQIYRDPSAASQALLWIELSNPDDVCEIRQTVVGQLNTLGRVDLIDDRIWEPTGWEVIGDQTKQSSNNKRRARCNTVCLQEHEILVTFQT